MTPPSLLAEWARLLVGSLVQAGVRDAVVSPGSRSTPLAWAAHRHPELTVHSVFDERSAAFFALGQGRATGRPSLLICTSGTAAANYFPAIVEASLAFVPLIALTADRPFEAQHAGAAQTIDQLKLYGDYCRAFFELGLPDSHPSALSGIKRIAAQAVARTLSPEPGPVHLNARARKPLEPAAGETAADRELAESVSRLLAQATTVSAPATREPNPRAIRVLADACRRAERGLVVCGPLGPDEAGSAEALVELHERTRFPILAEAASQYRFQGGALAAARLDGFGFLLRTPRFVEQCAPDLLICVGATPTSSGVERLIVDRPGLERHVIAPYGWPDPHGNARSVTVAGIEATLRALCAELSSGALPERAGARQAAIRRASELAEASVRSALQGEALSEGNATAAVVEALPDGAILVVGNSLPIRNVDSYAATRSGLTVLCQRGANGIDGLVAGAAGAARASGKPTLLLLGDVSLLHDLNSLALAQKLETPFVVAVLDNAGGRIFEQLPVARLFEADPGAAKLWLTPHGLDFEHAARLFALCYAAPRRPGEVRAAVERALAAPGATLVHLKVPADSAAELDRRILSEIDRSLL